MAKEGSKLAKEIERLKKRLQANKKHLKQTELKAEDLNALIETTINSRLATRQASKVPNKDGER